MAEEPLQKTSAPIGLPLREFRASPDEIGAIEKLLETWALEHRGATPRQVKSLQSCLSEDFLRGLAEPAESHFWPKDPGPNSWRYLFRRQLFRILGVYERLPEGHPSGIPEEVNTFIRTKWWPQTNPENQSSSTPEICGRNGGVRRGRGRSGSDAVRQRYAPYPGGPRTRGRRGRGRGWGTTIANAADLAVDP